MKKVLLHVCCGVCAFFCFKKLKEENFLVTGFFFNPNIYPPEEYLKRREAAAKAARTAQVEIIDGEYQPDCWFSACRPYSDEPEGGERCSVCYRLRLTKAFQLVKEKKFDYFTTTLAISPHKNNAVIAGIAKDIGGDKFLPVDFRKKDGFKQSMQLAKEHHLYRQKYCGCIYSKGER